MNSGYINSEARKKDAETKQERAAGYVDVKRGAQGNKLFRVIVP